MEEVLGEHNCAMGGEYGLWGVALRIAWDNVATRLEINGRVPRNHGAV